MKELEKLIQQEYKYLLRGMGKWDKNFFKDFFSSIMSKQTTVMKRLSLKSYKKVDKITERNKHFFEKESFNNFPQKIEKRCFGMVGEIRENDYICIDEVDIAKPSAKKMQGISKVRDGSTGKIVNGYIFHGVSIRGIPVILEQEDLTNKFKSQYFGNIIDRVLNYSKRRGIFVLDAGYDIASYMQFLNKRKANYIIRAKKDRWYFDVKNNKKLKLKEFSDGVYEVKIDKVEKTVYLHIKTNPKYDEPIRILSNLFDIDTDEYQRRWEIEQIFKTMKQEFEIEKIGTSNLQVLKNTIATVQLAVAISRVVYNQTNSFREHQSLVVSKRFMNRFEKFTKSEGITMNSNSIIKFISFGLQKLYKTTKKPNQNYINKNTDISSQMSLFTVGNLGKSGEI